MLIGIDIDNTINDLCKSVLSVYNEDSGDTLTIDDIKAYRIEQFVKPEYQEEFYKYFMDKRVWKRIKPIDKAVETIKEWCKEGHEIVFVTSTESYNLYKKEGWLKRLFPEINMRKSLCKIPEGKKWWLSELDVIIDDFSDNIINSKHHKILLDYPWNRDVNDKDEGIVRCFNWGDIFKEIKRFDKERKLKHED